MRSNLTHRNVFRNRDFKLMYLSADGFEERISEGRQGVELLGGQPIRREAFDFVAD